MWRRKQNMGFMPGTNWGVDAGTVGRQTPITQEVVGQGSLAQQVVHPVEARNEDVQVIWEPRKNSEQ